MAPKGNCSLIKLTKRPMEFISDGLFDVFMYFRIGNRAGSPQVLQVAPDGASTRVDQAELAPARESQIRVCTISDTHNRHRCVTVPPCDVLVHTGDILMTSRFRSHAGTIAHYKDFAAWLTEQPARHIIVLGGNHDGPLEDMSVAEVSATIFSNASNVNYLCNSYVDIGGYRFMGTPLSRGKSGNNGFQSASFKAATESYFREYRDRDKERRDSGRDAEAPPPLVLLTHGSCESLRGDMDPYLHFYGHYHAHYGVKLVKRGPISSTKAKLLSVCSSIMDRKYNPSNAPICLDIPRL